jgi:lipoprotein
MKKVVICFGVTFLFACSTTNKYTEDNSVVLKIYNLCGQDTSFVIPQGISKLRICDKNVTVDRIDNTLYLTGPVNELLVQIPEVQVHLTYHDLLIDDKP